jgi:hypothetical protein
MPLSVRLDQDVWIAAMAKLNLEVTSVNDANTDTSPFKFPLSFKLNKLCKLIAKKLRLPILGSLRDAHYYSAGQNMTELLRCNVELQKQLIAIIEDPECLDPAIFNIKRINELVDEHLTGKQDHNKFLYALITFGRWNKLFGPNSNNDGGT